MDQTLGFCDGGGDSVGASAGGPPAALTIPTTVNVNNRESALYGRGVFILSVLSRVPAGTHQLFDS